MAGVLDAPPPAPPSSAMDSLEELRAHLWKLHQTTVGENDPVLMLHTIHRVALDDFGRLLDRHDRTLSDRVEAAARHLNDEVRLMIADLKDEALKDAVAERLTTLAESGRLVEATQKHIKKALRSQIALTAVNYLALACTLGVLASIAV